jgi:ankyrin repeat protein
LIEAGADLNEENQFERTPLQHAVGCGRADLARKLLAAGAEVDLHDKGGRTALMHAAAKGSREFMDLLLEFGADVNARAGAVSVLTCAAMSRDPELIPYLISRGADPGPSADSPVPEVIGAAMLGLMHGGPLSDRRVEAADGKPPPDGQKLLDLIKALRPKRDGNASGT